MPGEVPLTVEVGNLTEENDMSPIEYAEWRQSGRCASGCCVQVARVGDRYLIRDGKNTAIPPLEFSRSEWLSFIGGIEDGDFQFD